MASSDAGGGAGAPRGDRRPSGTRREARERAVELCYEADAKGVHPDEVAAALPLPTDPYALALASGVADHRIEIDKVLDRHARGWPTARMAAMDRTVLRVGTLELATSHDVPRGAVLSEAVELGSRYGSTDDTPKFVNGVLAAVAREVRDDDGPASRPWTPIRVVVFDMDGVIRHWTGEDIRAFETAHGIAHGSVGKVAFADPLFHEAMTGAKTVEEWATQIGRRLAAEHDAVDEADATAMWLSTEWQLDDDVVALLQGLRDAGQPVALLSNASTGLEADLEAMGLADAFDHVANSSRLGLVKPDPAVHERVAADLADALADRLDGDELRPEHLLFVDDRPENVAGAVDAGWHAVQMTGVERLGAVLRRLDVPGAPAAP